MDRLLLLLSSISLGAGSAFPQYGGAAQITWGADLPSKEYGVVKSIMDHRDGAYYLWIVDDGMQMIAKMDGQMHIVYRKEIDQGGKESGRTLKRIIPAPDKFIVLSSMFNEGNQRNELYAREYAEQTYQPLGDRRVIASIDAEGPKNDGDFLIGFSNDMHHIRVKVQGVRLKDAPTVTTVRYFDLDLNETVLENESDMARSDPSPSGTVLDAKARLADGSVFCIGRKDRGHVQGAAVKDQTYWVSLFPPRASETKEFPIQLKPMAIVDLVAATASNGDVWFSGTYSETSEYTIDGVFQGRLDGRTMEVKSLSYRSILEDLVKGGMKEREASKVLRFSKDPEKRSEDVRIRLDRLVTRLDGSAVLVAEIRGTRTDCTISTAGSYSSTMCKDHHVNSDIIVLTIDQAGVIEALYRILKEQNSLNELGEFNGYVMEVGDGSVHFLFNDDSENAGLTGTEGSVRTFNGKSNDDVIMAVVLDHGGILHRSVVSDPGSLLKPSEALKTGDHQWLIHAVRDTDSRFGLVTFP